MPLVVVMPDIYPYVLIGITANFMMSNVSALISSRIKIGIFNKERREKLSDDHKKVFGAEAIIN